MRTCGGVHDNNQMHMISWISIRFVGAQDRMKVTAKFHAHRVGMIDGSLINPKRIGRNVIRKYTKAHVICSSGVAYSALYQEQIPGSRMMGNKVMFFQFGDATAMRDAAAEEFIIVFHDNLRMEHSLLNSTLLFRVAALNLATPEVATVVDL